MKQLFLIMTLLFTTNLVAVALALGTDLTLNISKAFSTTQAVTRQID